jgi:hypothetical protein
MKTFFRIALTVALSLVTVSTSPANAISNVPTVEWVTPVSGSTINGEFTLIGVATPNSGGTSTILKWCFTVDGSPLVGAYAYWSSDPSDLTFSYSSFRSTNDFGCIQFSGIGTNVRKVWVQFDSTSWQNSSHNISAMVTDSNGMSSSSTPTNFLTSTANPTVELSAPVSGSTVSGGFNVIGIATPDLGGTAGILKWCFTVDGSPLVGAYAYWSSDPSDLTYSYSSFVQTNSQGCFEFSGIGTDVRKVWVLVDSTDWINGIHQLAGSATDSSGRSSNVVSTSVIFSNPVPQFENLNYIQDSKKISLNGFWSVPDNSRDIDFCVWLIDDIESSREYCGGSSDESELVVYASEIRSGVHEFTLRLVFDNSTYVEQSRSIEVLPFPMTISWSSDLTDFVWYPGRITLSGTIDLNGGDVVSFVQLRYRIGSAAWSQWENIKVTSSQFSVLKNFPKSGRAEVRIPASGGRSAVTTSTSVGITPQVTLSGSTRLKSGKTNVFKVLAPKGFSGTCTWNAVTAQYNRAGYYFGQKIWKSTKVKFVKGKSSFKILSNYRGSFRVSLTCTAPGMTYGTSNLVGQFVY